MTYTPERVTELGPNDIFVFGSNLQGIHRRGSAKDAIERFGAIFGKGVGRQGQSYGIPTMNSLDVVGFYVDDLIEYAADHPDLTFWVTKIGTGIAGYSTDEIGDLFRERDLPPNVRVPVEFS